MMLGSIDLDSSPSDIAYISGLALVGFSAAFGYKLGGSMYLHVHFYTNLRLF